MANDIFELIDWIIKALELSALTAIVLFAYQKISILFFGGSKNINTDSDIILHSCFITALVVVIFHFIGSATTQYILALNLEKMEKRKLFYSAIFFMELIAILSIFTFHKVRSCLFAAPARLCVYLSFAMMMVQMLQCILHGIFDINLFSPVYRVLVLGINIATLSIISYYPVMAYLKRNYNEHKQ